MAVSAPQGAKSAAGVHVSTFVAPQFDDINPTGWPVARCRSRPKNQQTALKWPGQPPPMEEGEATAHGCSTQPKSLRMVWQTASQDRRNRASRAKSGPQARQTAPKNELPKPTRRVEIVRTADATHVKARSGDS